MTPRDLVKAFRAEFAEPLRQADYLLADTRIPWVSLYDHLVLTGGIAAAFAEELLRRRKTPEEICGLSLDPSELRHLACLCGLLHDLGKARVGETEYRFHVQRGVEYATEWLTAKGVDGRLHEIIAGSVARHHLRDGPQTLFEKLVCLADSYASDGGFSTAWGLPKPTYLGVATGSVCSGWTSRLTIQRFFPGLNPWEPRAWVSTPTNGWAKSSSAIRSTRR